MHLEGAESHGARWAVVARIFCINGLGTVTFNAIELSLAPTESLGLISINEAAAQHERSEC